jgi:hypothetical protein
VSFEAPKGYIIDVCMTCGRIAKWPFCEHRPEYRISDERPWTMPVQVNLSAGDRRRLAEAMARTR